MALGSLSLCLSHILNYLTRPKRKERASNLLLVANDGFLEASVVLGEDQDLEAKKPTKRMGFSASN